MRRMRRASLTFHSMFHYLTHYTFHSTRSTLRYILPHLSSHTHDGLVSRRSIGTSSRVPNSHDTRPYAHVTTGLLARRARILSPQFFHHTGTEG